MMEVRMVFFQECEHNRTHIYPERSIEYVWILIRRSVVIELIVPDVERFFLYSYQYLWHHLVGQLPIHDHDAAIRCHHHAPDPLSQCHLLGCFCLIR